MPRGLAFSASLEEAPLELFSSLFRGRNSFSLVSVGGQPPYFIPHCFWALQTSSPRPPPPMFYITCIKSTILLLYEHGRKVLHFLLEYRVYTVPMLVQLFEFKLLLPIKIISQNIPVLSQWNNKSANECILQWFSWLPSARDSGNQRAGVRGENMIANSRGKEGETNQTLDVLYWWQGGGTESS